MTKGKNVVDPFGTSAVSDYDYLFKEFGIEKLKPLLPKIKNPSRYMRRGIDFAHRGFDEFIKSFEKGEEVAVMSGIKPTGEFHLGSKMTAEKIIYFQKEFHAKVFYCIADIEAFADNGLSFEESLENAVGNVADLLALGLDPKNAYIYRQSQEIRVMRLAYLFSKKVTTNMMKGLYGKRELSLYNSALIQAGDILMPQLPEFGGPKQVLVPVGVDQDPHIRLSRDLASKFKDEFGFKAPSAVYHKFFRSLDGSEKMSKRNPLTYLLMSDPPELARKKIKNALTGGRDTLKEQKKLGGVPEKCVPFELCKYHFVEDDKKLAGIYDECVKGEIMCGPHKECFAEIIIKQLEKHQKKRKKMLPRAKKLLGIK